MSRDFTAASSMYLNYGGAVVSNPPITMACWFKSGSITTIQALISIGTSGAGSHRRMLRLRGDIAGDPLQIVSTTTSDAVANSTTGYSANTWHHACGVFAASNSRTIYLDGGSSASNSTSRILSGMNITMIGA